MLFLSSSIRPESINMFLEQFRSRRRCQASVEEKKNEFHAGHCSANSFSLGWLKNKAEPKLGFKYHVSDCVNPKILRWRLSSSNGDRVLMMIEPNSNILTAHER